MCTQSICYNSHGNQKRFCSHAHTKSTRVHDETIAINVSHFLCPPGVDADIFDLVLSSLVIFFYLSRKNLNDFGKLIFNGLPYHFIADGSSWVCVIGTLFTIQFKNNETLMNSDFNFDINNYLWLFALDMAEIHGKRFGHLFPFFELMETFT
jgi:hypothetical protein